ncbi:hypothetical protein A2U01_0114023, partial [Trifolium medium]|nr:hypothetical protein [Trifolium medium]
MDLILRTDEGSVTREFETVSLRNDLT